MGVMARKQDEAFIITSDRSSGDVPSKRAPRTSDSLQAWTGERWSADLGESQKFATMDAADEYVRVNYAKIMAEG